VKWMREAYGVQDVDRPVGLNSTLLLSEQRQFVDSADSLGLQLADMLAAILRRALNNRLQAPGWKNFGRLLIADSRTPFLQFGEPGGRSQRMHGQVEQVWPCAQDRQQRDARKTLNLGFFVQFQGIDLSDHRCAPVRQLVTANQRICTSNISALFLEVQRSAVAGRGAKATCSCWDFRHNMICSNSVNRY
jgi:Protein of unknown function (DUF3800)